MNKKITSSALAALMIAGTTSFSAFAAMASGTVVIGNKAFDINYVNNAANLAEITNLIISGAPIYVKDFNGNWINNVTGLKVDASVIPAVIYKSATGVITEFDAKDMDAVKTLAVTSVSAINLKTVEIKFNKAVDKDTITTTTLKIYKNGATALEGYTKSLSEDKMTLTVSLNNTLAQNDVVKVAIDAIKTVGAAESITAYSIEKTATDVTIPTVTDVRATTSTTLDVTFSEAMNITGGSKVWDEIYIDGVKTYATLATGSLDLNNKVTLTLATKLSVGTHTYKIVSFRDWAGFPVVTREGSVTVVSDAVAPTVTSATVTKNNEVTVVFDEPVNSATIALTSANFEFVEAGGTHYTVSSLTNTAGDNKTYELTLNAAFTPAAIVNIDLSYKGIADLEGNTVTTAKTYSFKAVDDLLKPTVSGVVKATNNTVDLTFSEKMDTTSVTNAANYALYKDGKKVTSTIVVTAKSGDTTGTKYVATFSNALDLSGAYLLRINNVKDASIRANTIVADTDVAITLVDVASPTISDSASTKEYKDTNSPVNGKDDKLKVVMSYSENMDSATALNLSNYIFNFGGSDVIGSTITDATIAFGADNKTVVITLPGTEVDATHMTIAGNTITTASQAVTVKVLAVKDAAGNVLKSTDINRAVTLTSYSSSAATLTSVKAIAANKIEIKSAVPFLSIDPNGIKFVGATAGTDVAQPVLVAGVSFSTDRKTATLTLGANLTADAKYDIDETSTITLQGLKLVTVSDTAIVNNLGQNVAKATTYVATSPNDIVINASTAYTIVDEITPSLASTNPITVKNDTTAADTIIVTFDENLGTLSAAQLAGIANDITVTIAGTVLDPSVGDYTVIEDGANDATIGIKIAKNGIVATDDVSVKLNNGRYIVDVAGNTATVFDTKTIKTGDLVKELVVPTAVTYNAVTAPTSFKGNGTTATIKFSEALDASTINAIGTGFEVSDGTVTGASLSTDGKTLTLTGTGLVATVTVTYTASTGLVKDLAGNALADIAGTVLH